MKQTMIERRNPLFAVIRDANHKQSMVNEDDIDFRIRGLPHSVVKQADNDRIRELVKKIENHLTDYLVNKIYNRTVYDPFSMNPKKMIQDMGNVELFGLFETDPKTQCKECFSYWSEGIVWCTCGSLERKCSEPRRHPTNIGPFLSVPDYVIKKGQLHGDRYEKAPEQKEHYLVHNLKNRDASRSILEGIDDRFLRDIEKSLWLQRSVVYIKPSTPRIGRTTIQTHSIQEVSALASIIEFFLPVGGNGVVLGRVHSNWKWQ